MSQPKTPPASAVLLRWRIKHTALRIAQVAHLLAVLQQLNVKRRKQIKVLAAQKPAPASDVALLAGPTVMFDAVTIANIPANAPAVAGYVGGHYPTFQFLRAHFPKAKLLSVAVASYYDGDCLDVEPGDATNAVAGLWMKRQLKRGVKRPKFYTSVSNAPALIAALRRAGYRRDTYELWTAHYTGHAHLCGPLCGFGIVDRADATQWTDRALGRSLDQSLLTPGFFE